MSRIDANAARPNLAGLPADDKVAWSPDASQNVRGLRRAITAHRADVPVDSEVAAMMPALLRRLDALTGPPAASALAAPKPPNPADPPGPEGLMRGLGQASAAIHDALKGANPQDAGAQRLKGLLRVLDGHLEMKHEIVMRAEVGRR